MSLVQTFAESLVGLPFILVYRHLIEEIHDCPKFMLDPKSVLMLYLYISKSFPTDLQVFLLLML